MASIVLKGVPDDLHRRLKQRADQHRRSMSQELLVIMEQALRPLPPLGPVKAVPTKRPFTHAWLRRAMREGRE